MSTKEQETSALGRNTDGQPIERPKVAVETDGLVRASSASPILNPDAAYLAATTKIDISGLPEFSTHDFITDDVLTVSFSTPMEKLTVPGSWATWSSPPFAEDPTPDVLFGPGATTLTMELSRPVKTFGFELEPNPFDLITYTVDFFHGGSLVESITREVQGFAGARLFARTNQLIDRVVITGDFDFAIAQVRYALAPPPGPRTQLTPETFQTHSTKTLKVICREQVQVTDTLQVAFAGTTAGPIVNVTMETVGFRATVFEDKVFNIWNFNVTATDAAGNVFTATNVPFREKAVHCPFDLTQWPGDIVVQKHDVEGPLVVGPATLPPGPVIGIVATFDIVMRYCLVVSQEVRMKIRGAIPYC